MTEPMDQLRAFAREVLEDYESKDGADLFDIGRRHGLLIPVPVEKRCGEDCNCDGYGMEFPGNCWRFSDVLKLPPSHT